ncbi:TetR/AcrR family transcriptional regulator [Streptomyces kunmingensis]|uniref:TetR/AcrR family transcriptional regulator n=1 Tax=Streptomyces kunmingensis TaxID=68225 RepID=A0ABU6CQ33_9ACTN|nr:helix-turn-helix domain-containing protein [Streptomyces kunmingensis]MEB3966853.1 TetR/AcrR family transcriptional regulator [Streptomyces kunmingensis]
MTNPAEPRKPQASAPGADAPGSGRPANQGRRVAARNRAALIAAAREVFAEQGLNAPLSAVARRAGVGQGSLYRHFADRVALASAVLDENVRQIELAADGPGASLKSVLGVVTWHMTRSTAFVDLLRVRGDGKEARALAGRVHSVLARCQPAGHALSADDLMLAVAMVSGAVAGPTLAERERLALRAWKLLRVEVGPVRPWEAPADE